MELHVNVKKKKKSKINTSQGIGVWLILFKVWVGFWPLNIRLIIPAMKSDALISRG